MTLELTGERYNNMTAMNDHADHFLLPGLNLSHAPSEFLTFCLSPQPSRLTSTRCYINVNAQLVIDLDYLNVATVLEEKLSDICSKFATHSVTIAHGYPRIIVVVYPGRSLHCFPGG